MICRKCDGPGPFSPKEKRYCRSCKNEMSRAYYHANLDKMKARTKRRAADPKFRAKVSAYRKKWRKRGGESHEKEKRRNWNIKLRQYGLDEQKFQEMLAAQGGVCAICKQPETRLKGGRVKRIAVDHDHATGVVRGLLCHQCNSGIGNFKDSPDLLAVAIAYLIKPRTK